ncbi:hypothetical protein [Phascolarctobacterium succinatutens]|uniref:hypothetical protein n=1 Tax=Phascolarctobacterium succinatutens TaxID=626940 RepID=UPI0040254BE0
MRSLETKKAPGATNTGRHASGATNTISCVTTYHRRTAFPPVRASTKPNQDEPGTDYNYMELITFLLYQLCSKNERS